MEVVVPVREFRMESETTSPYVSAPSSPRLFAGAAPDDDDDDDDDNLFEFELEFQSPRRSSNNNNNPFDLRFHYCSVPSSPTRAAALFAHFSAHGGGGGRGGGGGGGGEGGGEGFVPRPSSFFSTVSMVPFDWEEKPGTPKPRFSSSSAAAAEEFAFDFEARGPPPELAAADELFHHGRIRPLKPPPRLQQLAAADDRSSPASSPRSPRIRALLSPRRRRRGEDFDPFVAAMAEATKERGRDPSFAPSRSRSRKGSRSLSPLRVGVVGGHSNPFGNPFEPNPNSSHPSPSPPPLPNTSTSSSSSSSSSSTSTSTSTNTTKKVGKRWRLSDLLLFRSASDGRITTNRSKDHPIFKHSPMSLFSSFPSTVSPSPSPSKVSREKNDSISKSTKRDDQSTNGVEQETTKKKKKKRASFAAPVHFFSRLRFNPVVNRFARGFTNSG